MIKFKKTSFDRKKYEEMQPGMTFSSHTDISENTFTEFQNIYENGTETDIHIFLEANPTYLYFALSHTGHHGFWSRSKPQIRPPLINGKKGHIPDFLLCGSSSNGTEWFAIELKGPQAKLFNNKGTAFSPDANEGIVQLVDYVDYINRNISTIRTTLEIPNLNPVKGILLIGKHDETFEDEVKQELKAAFNRTMKGIDLVSYSRIYSWANEHFEFTKSKSGS